MCASREQLRTVCRKHNPRGTYPARSQDSFTFLGLGRILGSTWPLGDGPNPITEDDVLLATHGWWPWLLTFAVILIVVGGVIAYFVQRRRAI
jgi:hypothetical protein